MQMANLARSAARLALISAVVTAVAGAQSGGRSWAADTAFSRPGELAFPRLRLRPPGSWTRLSAGRRKEYLRAGHLGAQFPVPQGNVLHLRQRESIRSPGLSRHRSSRPMEAQSNRAGTARPLRPLRRRRQDLRRLRSED